MAISLRDRLDSTIGADADHQEYLLVDGLDSLSLHATGTTQIDVLRLDGMPGSPGRLTHSGYSSRRRIQSPVSFRPSGARSSHWYMLQTESSPRL